MFKDGNVSCLTMRLKHFLKLAKYDFKLCETWKQESESYAFFIHQYSKNTKNFVKECNSSCTHLQYIGQNTFSKGRGKDPNKVHVSYDFLSNEIQVIEEYVMFGVNDLIGTIGGHSGLFIGFSFYGFVCQILGYFQRKLQ